MRVSLLALLLLSALAGGACAPYRHPARTLVSPERVRTLDGESPYLKAHMRDGSLYVLREWDVDSSGRTVNGLGVLHDAARTPVESGLFALAVDSVALFETNVTRTHGSLAAITLLVGASAGMTVFCLADSKNCFGSCPTFYVDGTDGPFLAAEGFSASIAPSLEASDVDALAGARPDGRRLDVRMTNEALETHVVRHVRVLVAPRLGRQRVLRAADGAFVTADLFDVASCRAAEGDCIAALRDFDRVERFSAADSFDLATRETIELEFDAPGGPIGIAIAARQSLLSSYLLYQTLAWLGGSTGTLLARLSARGDLSLDQAWGMRRALGGIEVLVESDGGWTPVGEVHETGPIATDVHLLRLPAVEAGRMRVRLSLTKGHWRIDQVALASLGPDVTPLAVAPVDVLRDGVSDGAALARLREGGDALVTMPGDAYTLRFELPDDADDAELFLDSRGYYLEWMRQEWLAEEDPARARMMLLDPARALRELAPAYVAQEARMEEIFWGSRYVPR